MLHQDLQQLALKVASLASAIWISQKTNIMASVFSSGDTEEVLALKMSAFLSGSEFVGNYVVGMFGYNNVPTMSNTLSQFGYAFVVNAVVLYVFQKLQLDDKIITGGTPEMRAVQMAVLFVLVQELSHYVLTYVWKSYF